MISAEAPILFSKACEIFICEITRRAWLHAEENKRRTLQRSDVASAVSRSDQFDFLIDIVPREEPVKATKRSSTREETAPSVRFYVTNRFVCVCVCAYLPANREMFIVQGQRDENSDQRR